MDSRTRTGTRSQERDDQEPGTEAPRLIVAMDCQHPLTMGTRIGLEDVDEVIMGRGPARSAERQGRTIVLTVPDSQMSRQHFCLRRLATGWGLTDVGSKNGTVVNGKAVRSVSLADGDLIEVGGTMLWFLEQGPREARVDRGDLDLDAGEGGKGPAVFRTLSLELEGRWRDLTRIAASSTPVLVQGETGTGKELVARAVHELSGQRGPFVAINCGALPRTLVESELFGFHRGAFSGATHDREGLIRHADGGTLFLDEIAELPEESQVALLRVLQDGEVRPIGSSTALPVNLRVVAATHQDLSERIVDGRFRRDLYARLAGFLVTVPPLRERREDIGTLIGTLLPRLGVDVRRVSFQRPAARALLRYGYPLNIRELEQALRAAVVLADGREIRLEHLPESVRTYDVAEKLPISADDHVLRVRLLEVLREVQGNVAAAGRRMNKAPIQIRRWCRRFGLDLDDFRGDAR